MKNMKKWFIFTLSTMMMIAHLTFPQAVAAASDNVAFKKPVTVSGVEGGYIDETTLKYPQFNPVHATDGSMGTHTSLDYGDPQWIEVDLEAEYALDTIVVHFANTANDYGVQYRTTAEDEWVELERVSSGGTAGLGKSDKTVTLPADTLVRYIRVYQYFGFRNAGHQWDYSMGIYEIEAFEKPDINDLDVVMEEIKNYPPIIDGDHVVLPSVESTDIEVSLYGSSNKAVVGLDGRFVPPLEDMDINIFYKLTNTSTNETLEMDEPVVMHVEGLYDDGQVNRPAVLPGIREWKGNDGTFNFSGNIIVNNEAYVEAANIAKAYIEGMSGISVNIASGEAQTGDIVFVEDDSLSVGEEGYTMDISDIATIKAYTHVGFVYAGATLSQMLMSGSNTLSKGLMRDYPQYDVRSTMIDLGRFYIPLDYVEEIVMYASFFKLNEFHAHINDDGGEQGNAFRVESKLYPEINAGIAADHVYSQEDYKAFQKRVKKYGIEIVTEIDAPAHSACFANVKQGAYMLDGSHINLANEEAMKFLESLYDEFLDGEDPVFQARKFDIGADEYRFEYAEEMRAFMDRMTKYIAAKGVEPRLWCNLNDNKPTGMYQGFGGDTPVSNLGVQRYYNDSTCDLQTLLDGEYRIINNMYQSLYIVPILINGCNDYLDIEALYDSWDVGLVSPSDKELAAGHPLLMGAETSIWNDGKVGCSEFDLFDRCQDQVMLISEKCWYGEATEGQSAQEYMQRVATFGKETPLSNPARYVESKEDVFVSYDFAKMEDGIVKDQSSNGYDATVNGLNVDPYHKALKLDGKGSISLPFESKGFPYVLDFDLYISSNTGMNAKIFDSEDGTLYYNYDGTGKFGFERKDYKFIFDFVVPKDVMMHYTIKCDELTTKLYVENTYMATAQTYNTWVYREGSSTFVLPTASIGSGVKGYIKSLQISKPSQDEQTLIDNIALHKEVEVSGVEGGYKEDGTLTYPKFDPQNATDGSVSTGTSLAYGSPQHVIIDLEDTYVVNKVIYNFSNTPREYKLYASLDKEEWKEIAYSFTDKNTIGARIDTYELSTLAKARYLKFEQLSGFIGNNYLPDGTIGPFEYSAGIFEIEAYGLAYSEFEEMINEIQTTLASVEKTDENKALYEFIEQECSILEMVINGETASSLEEALGNAKSLVKYANDLASGDITITTADKTKLQALLSEKVDTTGAKEEAIEEYEQALILGQTICNDMNASQDKVDYAVDMIENAIAKLTHTNIALHKAVEVSGVEGGYRDDGTLTYPQFNPQNVTDGNEATHTSLDYGNPQHVIVDLGGMHKISEVVINFSHVPREYSVYASNDKEEWVKIGYSKYEQNAIGARVDAYEMSQLIYARYIKMEQTSGHIGAENFEYSAGIYELEVYGSAIERVNLALGKPASASAVEGGTRPDGSLVYPQFAPSKVTDGSLDTGRCSLDYVDEAWIEVDLEAEYTIGEVNLVLNPTPNAYKVQVSTDREEWIDIDVQTGLAGGTSNVHANITHNGIKARYVRYLQTERWYHSGHDFYYSSGLTEMMVYEAQSNEYASLKAMKQEAESLDASKYSEESFAILSAVLEEIAPVNAVSKPEMIVESIERLRLALEQLEESSIIVENVNVQAVDYKTIQLTWDANDKAESYIVERLDNNTGNWMELATTTSNQYTYTTAKTGKEYFFRVKAVAQALESEYSEVVSTTTTLEGDVQLVLNTNEQNQFELSWNKVDGATRYVIYRRTNDGEWKKYLTLGKDATTYTTKAMPKGTYQYQVKAARYDGSDRVMTNGSNTVEGNIGEEVITLQIDQKDATSIRIQWNRVSGADGYDVYRAKGDGAYRMIMRTKNTEMVNSTVKMKGTYSYKVKAFKLVNGNRAYQDFSEAVSYQIQ